MLRLRAALAALIGLTGVAAVGLGAGPLSERAAPDAVLADDYDAALADADTSWSTLPRNIWLSGLGGGMAADGELAQGDTITISTKHGQPQVIEVMDLELIDGDRMGVPGVRFQLVTGRFSGSGPGQVVRFMFATEAPSVPPPPTSSARVL